MRVTLEEIRDKLLYPCWRGVPDAYKRKYARNIWQQFEDNIRSAAYTSSLPKFLDMLMRKLDIQIRGDDVAAINAALAGNEREMLRALRNETTALVLMIRLKNEERRAETEAGK